jgi:hypothetical protein
MFSLIQHQNAAYDGEEFMVTIGVYSTKKAAEKAAADMNAACMNAYGADAFVHSVMPVPVDKVITDLAHPFISSRDYDTLTHFEHVVSGCSGSPPIEIGGILKEYEGRTEFIPGPKLDAFRAKLQSKLTEHVNVHDARKLKQWVGYRNEECWSCILNTLNTSKGCGLSELDIKVLKTSFFTGYTCDWKWLDDVVTSA